MYHGEDARSNNPYSDQGFGHGGGYEPSRRRQLPGEAVRLHCRADPNFCLAAIPGQGPVMVPNNESDAYQVWYKDESMSNRVKDESGAHAFSLINKATGECLRHPPEDLQQCLLVVYEPNAQDESVLWTMSEDMGQGYRCIRVVTSITRNLDVLRGDKKSGGMKNGSSVITFAWKNQDNQVWKMTPVGPGIGGSAAQPSIYPSAPGTGVGVSADYEPPRRRQLPGHAVRLHCRADPNFSIAVIPGQGTIMVPTNASDAHQIWYRDESMSNRVTDESGAHAFALINKVTGECLRHPPEDLKQCLLADYEPNGLDESVLWTMSEDMGQGYRCIRVVTSITRNLDVLRGDKKSGGVKTGSPLITFAWKNQDNQVWKMTPAFGINRVGEEDRRYGCGEDVMRDMVQALEQL
uniref:Uncharacterized protein n=1 Tax=Physcomitrium patens TaxID=3218 RepID=A0A7I4CRW2_PHYPA